MKEPHCRKCDRTGHYSTFCTYTYPSGKKPKNGKYHKKWLLTRKEWFKENPADHYICYICGKWLEPEETTLDHRIPRSRAPELRYEFSNLFPCCFLCNTIKGSKVLDI